MHNGLLLPGAGFQLETIVDIIFTELITILQSILMDYLCVVFLLTRVIRVKSKERGNHRLNQMLGYLHRQENNNNFFVLFCQPIYFANFEISFSFS